MILIGQELWGLRFVRGQLCVARNPWTGTDWKCLLFLQKIGFLITFPCPRFNNVRRLAGCCAYGHLLCLRTISALFATTFSNLTSCYAKLRLWSPRLCFSPILSGGPECGVADTFYPLALGCWLMIVTFVRMTTCSCRWEQNISSLGLQVSLAILRWIRRLQF